MATTQYLNLNKPIGSDLVNPLIDTFPNWDIVDEAYHGIDIRSLGRATELVSQGVHAITVIDTDCKTIKWTATANFTAGETFTVNGIQCNAYLPSGEDLGTNAYVSGAQVIASLNDDNSAMTIYVPQGTVAVASDSERLGGELPGYYATKSYADSIKSTADSASDLISKKILVNTYYDSIDNKFYQVNADGTQGNEINAPHNYSSTEKIVGTLNGDIVYEKTYYNTSRLTTNTVIDSTLLPTGINALISVEGSGKTDDNIYWTLNTIGSVTSVYVTIESNGLTLHTNRPLTNACITYRYTKV